MIRQPSFNVTLRELVVCFTVRNKVNLRRILHIGRHLILLQTICVHAYGASAAASLTGIVTDPSGRVVPEARVVVRNEQTNATRETLTSPLGEYIIPLLRAGMYEVSIEKQGFRRSIQHSVKLDVEQTARLDCELQLGEFTQSVTISAEPPLLESESSSIGHVVDGRRLVELPLNERNFLEFTLLVPGAQLPVEGSQNSTIGASVSVNGAREQSNNMILDGVDNNDLSTNFYSALPSVEAIQEFRVQSSNSTAEFGRSGGAQINVVVKSGSNKVHGTGFWFLRNRHLDAKNYFDLPDCTPTSVAGTCGDIPRMDRSQFGGSIGGPVRRDKTFFFGSYEGLRLRQAVTREASVPSLVRRAAALAAVPAAERNPAGESTLRLYPAANTGPNLATSSRHTAAPVLRRGVEQLLGKADHHFSATDTIFAHYTVSDEDRYNPYDPFFAFTRLPGFGDNLLTRGQNTGSTWIHSFGVRATNQARFGFNRLRSLALNESSGIDRSSDLGYPNLASRPESAGYPNVTIAGFDGIGEPTNTPQQRVNDTFTWADTLAWIPAMNGGRHEFRLGGEVRLVRLSFFVDPVARGWWQFLGSFSGDPLQDLLRGTPEIAISTAGNTDSKMSTNAFNVFVQDNIRIHPRLTLNVGFRYEFNSPPVEAQDRLSIPDTSAKSLTCSPMPDCQFLRAGTGDIPRATFRADKNNFAPRIGFVWRPSAEGTMAIRAAYGIFYDVGILNGNIGPRFNPPFVNTMLHLNTGVNTIQDIFSAPGLRATPIPTVIASDYRDGYMQHASAGVQYEAIPGTVLELGYIGSRGTSLLNIRNPNQPRPGGQRPYPQFGPWQYVETGSSSVYNAMQFRAERRTSRGFGFLGAYTWSKSIDNASSLLRTASEPAFPQDSYNLRAERGLSSFDARHRMVTSFLYEPLSGARGSGLGNRLLRNWRLGGTVVLQSGRPFTVNSAVDQSGTGTAALAAADRPDVIADPFLPGPVANHPDPGCRSTISEGGRASDNVRTPESWFNACAFAPAPGRFGNAGRNILIGPGLFNIDLSVLRDFPVFAEGHRLQLRIEFFNLLNHPNFDNPDRILESPTFGRVLSSNAFGTRPPRQIQLGVKYIF